MLSYGYRSKCCYAPIHIGTKKVKNTNMKIQIWICNKCGKRDVDLVEYNKDGASRTTQKNKVTRKFAEDPEDSPQELIEE